MIPEFRCFISYVILSLHCCQNRIATEGEITQRLRMPMIFFFLQSHLFDGVLVLLSWVFLLDFCFFFLLTVIQETLSS